VLTVDERLRIHNGGDAIRIKVVIDRRPTLRIERAGRRLSPSPGPTQPEQGFGGNGAQAVIGKDLPPAIGNVARIHNSRIKNDGGQDEHHDDRGDA
jgi:hypothetical protein